MSRDAATTVADVGLIEFEPGDVVYVPEGPFSGICAVVQEVDSARSELRVEVAVGEQRHGLTMTFDEVEWA